MTDTIAALILFGPLVLFGAGLIWDQVHRRGSCDVCRRAGVLIEKRHKAH